MAGQQPHLEEPSVVSREDQTPGEKEGVVRGPCPTRVTADPQRPRCPRPHE